MALLGMLAYHVEKLVETLRQAFYVHTGRQ